MSLRLPLLAVVALTASEAAALNCPLRDVYNCPGTCQVDCANSTGCFANTGSDSFVDCAGSSCCVATVATGSAVSCTNGGRCEARCEGQCLVDCGGAQLCEVVC